MPATLDTVLHRLGNQKLSYTQGPHAKVLIEREFDARGEEVQALLKSERRLKERVCALSKQLELVPEGVLELSRQVASLTNELFEDPKLEMELQEGPVIADGEDFCKRAYRQLAEAQNILKACQAVFKVKGEHPIEKLLAEKEAQFSEIANMIEGASDGAQIVKKVQEVLAERALLKANISELQGQETFIKRFHEYLQKEGGNLELCGLFPEGPLSLNDAREKTAHLQERIQVLDGAKAALDNVDEENFVQEIHELRENLAARNGELQEKERELAEEQSFIGTVWRVASGMVNGFINILKFFFVSIPTYVIDTLRYLGGVAAR